MKMRDPNRRHQVERVAGWVLVLAVAVLLYYGGHAVVATVQTSDPVPLGLVMALAAGLLAVLVGSGWDKRR